jgi:transcriptional regulator with XRE-family HTH domain
MPRKLSKPRPRQGAHLAALRKAAGLSQAELAQLLGQTQQNIAYWERSSRAPRSDVLPKLAQILGVRVEDILHPERPKRVRQSGPVGKAQRIFSEVQKLPRSQQDKILSVVAALLEQYKRAS